MSNAKGPVLIALVANFLIAIAKYIAAFFTGSAAMLAEAYHSTSDTLNQIFLLIGLRDAKKKPDAKHPFGYGKSTYFWSFVVAIMLFGIAGTLSVIHGIEKLRHPHAPDPSEAVWAFGVLGFAIILETFALRAAVKELKAAAKGKPFKKVVKETKDAALLTILFEDGMALAGLAIAAVGLGLSLWTHNGLYDAAASLVIGLMLMGFSLVLANRNRSLLMGESIDSARQLQLIGAIERDPQVHRLGNLRTMYLKADDVLIAADVDFADGLTTEEISAATDRIEQIAKGIVPEAKNIYIETEEKVRPSPQ